MRLALVNDLLDHSRLSVGKFVLDRSPTDLSITAKAVLASLMPMIEQNGQRPIDLISDRLPCINVDEHRLEQVLVNLFHGAIKLSPPGGLLRFHARVEGDWLIFEVQDSGVGIGQGATQVFERYTQFGGTWLGLSISKSLVEAHGGTMGVRSEKTKATPSGSSCPSGAKVFSRRL